MPHKNVLDFIKKCVSQNKIMWTYHVNMRLKERFISRLSILDSADSYEIIEMYPDDHNLPSCLLYTEYNEIIFHIVFAMDIVNEHVRIITAYKPNPDKWETDLKTRRK